MSLPAEAALDGAWLVRCRCPQGPPAARRTNSIYPGGPSDSGRDLLVKKKIFRKKFKFNNLLRLYKLIFKTKDNFKIFLSLKLFVMK